MKFQSFVNNEQKRHYPGRSLSIRVSTEKKAPENATWFKQSVEYAGRFRKARSSESLRSKSAYGGLINRQCARVCVECRHDPQR